MHIVFVITRADQVGGATIHVRDMSKALLARGNKATVLVGGEGPVTAELLASRIPHRSLQHLMRPVNPVQDSLAVIEIARHLRELRPDLVSTHTAKAGMVGRIASRIVGSPAIFTPHGWSIGDRISRASGLVFRIAERCGARLSVRIVNVCEYEKQLAVRYRIASTTKLAIIHNGMPDVPVSLRANPRHQPPRLIMVARMDKPKDHATLLCALSKLQDLPWSLDLVGTGPRESTIRRLATELGISGRLTYHGSSRVVADQLSLSDLFVLSSVSEAFPRSILEAMRAGLPVIATDVGGISEAVKHNKTGFLVPKTNPDLLSSYLSSLICNPAMRAEFGQAARRRYESHFTFDKMFSKSMLIYDEVLRRESDLALASMGEA